ncbi:MAG TPA: metallophosphoesterase, partial [Burkholderiaceae bacterium]|nr:metallophosphoesterase [Burkholderiaceae bacterium]
MATPMLSKVIQLIQQEQDRFVAAVVHLNDTYVIEERAGRLPGFPRLIATIQYLRDQVTRVTGQINRVLVLHSGDFIGPSLLSNHDHGASITELLHRAGLDYCLPGNHEFDHGVTEL